MKESSSTWLEYMLSVSVPSVHVFTHTSWALSGHVTVNVVAELK